MAATKKNLLVIGGQFTGTFVARELRKSFNVTVVDAKEYMEYTPGILRAYVKPDHFAALSFLLEPVLVKKLRVKFIVGEVKELNGDRREANVKLLLNGEMQIVTFDYCIICAGCSFGPLQKWGESLWFPTIHEDARKESEWPDLDERYYESRKRHIFRENQRITELNNSRAKVLVVGAGFIGVEWVTELQHFFPDLDLTIIDFLPRCLGPLPDSAANYCSKYMKKVGIKEHYSLKYDPKNQEFWKKIELPNQAEKIYVCSGVKASNYFMPKETKSEKGPGGGGWIYFNKKLQVTVRPAPGEVEGATWAGGCVFAVGDCNYGCIGEQQAWYNGGLPPMPKISYPGEEQAMHACKNVSRLAAGKGEPLMDTWWPWGAGMFSTSLGTNDACFVIGATERKGSGYMVAWWWPAAVQKDLIEKTKVWECKDWMIGKAIWHFVHHTPINLWGRGPWIP